MPVEHHIISMRIHNSIITTIRHRDRRLHLNRLMKAEGADPIAEHGTITPSRTKHHSNTVAPHRIDTRREVAGRPRGITQAVNHNQGDLATINPNTTNRRDKDQQMLLPLR